MYSYKAQNGRLQCIVGALFCCNNLIIGEGGMNMEKFLDKLIQDETLEDIPVSYLLRVAFSVLAIINSGECFFKDTFD